MQSQGANNPGNTYPYSIHYSLYGQQAAAGVPPTAHQYMQPGAAGIPQAQPLAQRQIEPVDTPSAHPYQQQINACTRLAADFSNGFPFNNVSDALLSKNALDFREKSELRAERTEYARSFAFLKLVVKELQANEPFRYERFKQCMQKQPNCSWLSKKLAAHEANTTPLVTSLMIPPGETHQKRALQAYASTITNAFPYNQKEAALIAEGVISWEELDFIQAQSSEKKKTEEVLNLVFRDLEADDQYRYQALKRVLSSHHFLGKKLQEKEGQALAETRSSTPKHPHQRTYQQPQFQRQPAQQHLAQQQPIQQPYQQAQPSAEEQVLQQRLQEEITDQDIDTILVPILRDYWLPLAQYLEINVDSILHLPPAQACSELLKYAAHHSSKKPYFRTWKTAFSGIFQHFGTNKNVNFCALIKEQLVRQPTLSQNTQQQKPPAPQQQQPMQHFPGPQQQAFSQHWMNTPRSHYSANPHHMQGTPWHTQGNNPAVPMAQHTFHQYSNIQTVTTPGTRFTGFVTEPAIQPQSPPMRFAKTFHPSLMSRQKHHTLPLHPVAPQEPVQPAPEPATENMTYEQLLASTITDQDITDVLRPILEDHWRELSDAASMNTAHFAQEYPRDPERACTAMLRVMTKTWSTWNMFLEQMGHFSKRQGMGFKDQIIKVLKARCQPLPEAETETQPKLDLTQAEEQLTKKLMALTTEPAANSTTAQVQASTESSTQPSLPSARQESLTVVPSVDENQFKEIPSDQVSHTCPICWQGFLQENMRTLAVCGHTYCRKCTDDIPKKLVSGATLNCPLCRKPYQEYQIIPFCPPQTSIKKHT